MTQLTLELAKCSRITQRGAIYEYLLECGRYGATDLEIQAALNLSGDTVRPRRQELQKSGRVYDTEEKRRTKLGRLATVWCAL